MQIDTQLTPASLAARQAEEPDLVLVDVRRQEEVNAEGVIEAANLVQIPVEELIDRKDLWPADYHTPIVVYCAGGIRSAFAAGLKSVPTRPLAGSVVPAPMMGWISVAMRLGLAEPTISARNTLPMRLTA